MASKGNKEVSPTFKVMKAAQWITVPYDEQERGKPDGKNITDLNHQVNSIPLGGED